MLVTSVHNNPFNYRYSIGADDDFQHHSYPSAYPSAPTDNEPYNPGYYDRQVGLSLKCVMCDVSCLSRLPPMISECCRSLALPYLEQATTGELGCTAQDQLVTKVMMMMISNDYDDHR